MALVAHTFAGSTNGTTVTSSAINTTGSTLLTVVLTDSNGTGTVSDSKSNTWIALTPQVTTSVNGAVRLYYAVNPTVGSGHTFSAAGAGAAVAVQAFDSVITSSPFESETGATQPGATLSTLTLPALTPAQDGALFVTGFVSNFTGLIPHLDTPFTDGDATALVPGQHYPVASGYYEQVTAAAQVTPWFLPGAAFPEMAGVVATFKTVAAPASTAPVAYEDPCAITEPRIYATVKTEDETLKFGVQPLRDGAALGGYAEPRLLEVSPCTRVASDPSTGAWSAQTASMRWADTDRANRARSETRTSFRGCDAEIYLTSNQQRLAELPPRILFAGTVYEDSADPNLLLSTTINDLIGSNYSLFSEEKQIPQRVIEKNWFPNAPDTSLGQAEPIVGGRRAVLNPVFWDNIEGVSKGVYVGQVRINGSHGTPTGTTLAAVVAALEASRAGGTLYVDYGSRIGYSDAIVLQGMGSVPSDYDGLAAVIGYSDLNALLAEDEHTGGDLYEAVVIAGHAISEILTATNTEPSIWIGDTQVPAADIGVSVWAPQIPGDISWGADISSDPFTDILGADGTTRRYTLILFDPGSGHGTDVAGGAVVHVDCVGLEDAGDGSGTAITDYFSLYRHVLINFILQDWQSGAWLASPQFLFSDGVTLLDRVDTASFDTASSVAMVTTQAGRLGSFTITERASVRDIIARFNLSGGCLLAQDDYGQLFVKVLDVRRADFLKNRFTDETHRTLRDKVDFLSGFTITAKPDWQVNRLIYQYAHNDYAGAYERDAGGGGNTVFVEDVTSQARDGVLKKTIELAYVADDTTADAVATYYLQLFKDLPRVATYTRRGLCGLEDDLLDGIPITHYNGYGASGWTDHAVWIIGKTFDPKRMVANFTALDVEAQLVIEETPEPDPLLLDPVGLEDLFDDVSGDPLYADT